MISLIKFNKITTMPLEEAKELGLTIDTTKEYRVGIQDNGVEVLQHSWYYLKNDTGLLPTVDREGKDCYISVEDNKLVCELCLYNPLPEGSPDYIGVEGEHLVDLLSFAEKCHYDFSIIRSIQEKNSAEVGLQAVLAKVESKVTTLTKLIDAAGNTEFNENCNVHVGGGLIATFNEIGLREDACSDALSIALNDGWRIIAVCVQPDQRRPDYILGRYNTTLDVEQANKAKRG